MSRPYNNSLRIILDEAGANAVVPILKNILEEVKQSRSSWTICSSCGCLLSYSDPSCPMCRFEVLNGVT